MQLAKIALRNTTRQLKRTLLLGGAIAFGFFVFTVLNGFTGGLIETVQFNFASALGGHIYISGTEVSELGSEISVIGDTEAVLGALGTIDQLIASYNTRSSANTSIIFGAREENQRLIGADFGQEDKVLGAMNFVEGTPEAFLERPDGLLLPQDVIEKLGLEIGESVIVKTNTISGQQNVADLVVVGSLNPQDAGFGITLGFAHIEALNTLLDMEPNEFQTLNIYLDDLALLPAATGTLYRELKNVATVEPRTGGSRGPNFARAFGLGRVNRVAEDERWQGTKFSVTNLEDRMEGVMSMIGVMENISLIIFLVILVIIMVGVMNSYRMVMIERTVEIGTMRAMGVQRSGIRSVFIWEAFFIALGGALAGLVAAFAVMAGLELFDFSSSSWSFFLKQGHIQFGVGFFDTVVNMALLCVMSIASVYLPARSAAQLRPAEALRASF
ncbi:MAG: ABC transporter permease [Trueperaceae bacterium]|nr:MAG: ABC transporter permease [Trueperaceae bacterium]